MAGWLSRPSEHERVEALLSPYLDGRVTPLERMLVERHLQACSECSRGLATLRATVTAVREMPRIRAPRSFALPRSMARQPQTNPWLVPVLRAATAVATFLLVVTVAGDLFLRGMSVPTAAPVAFAPVAQEPGARSVVSSTSQAEARDLSATPIELPVEDALGRDGRGGGPEPTLGGGGAVPPSGAGAAAPLAPTQPAAALTSVQATPATKNADAASSVPTLTVGAQPMPAPLAASAPTTSTSAAKLSVQQVPTASPTPPPVPKRAAFGLTPTTGAQSESAPVALPPMIAPAQPTESAHAAPAPVAPAPSADQAQTESQAASQSTAWRIAEGLLAVLAIAFGVAAWIAHRRSR